MSEIFHNKLQRLWNSLEVRVLVILSLFLQFCLISTGNRRKYTRTRRIKLGVWLAYLSADSVATIALGVLSRSEGNGSSVDPRYPIMAFWAPFLLMHLGGPDTITAYALADNELWARHFLGLISQVGVALYVLFRSWTGTVVNYLWLVVFLAGLIKYGERTCVLYLASKDRYRKSMVSLPDPGPNYSKFMDEYISKETEGHLVSLVKAIDDVSAPEPIDPATNVILSTETESQVIADASVLLDAYYFFGTFKKLFADLILSFQDKETSLSFFKTQSWDRAFRIVEVELGLMYDLFYTKAFLLYSPLGCFLRLLSCSFTVIVFIAFLNINKHMYPKTEVFFTYILLVGAIFLEIYAIIILVSSDRTMIWLSEDWKMPGRLLQDPIISIICKIVSMFQYIHIIPSRRRWSNAIGQYNVLNYCLASEPMCSKVSEFLDKYLFKDSIYIPNGLKALIFDNLKIRIENNQLGTCRGDKLLLKEIDCFQRSGELEFDQSLILWHIATDLCYLAEVSDHSDTRWLYEFEINEQSLSDEVLKFKREMSRWLSDYMLYLLIKNPFMLPSGIGQIRFQDTCAEAKEFLENVKHSRGSACEKLLQVKTRIPPSEVKGDRSKSLLFDACKIAESLILHEGTGKWEKIFHVWLDVLTFAAAQCRWSDHAEKLSQGGELLTHVWLLMAHLGMTDHFQISQGYVRAKLQTEKRRPI